MGYEQQRVSWGDLRDLQELKGKAMYDYPYFMYDYPYFMYD